MCPWCASSTGTRPPSDGAASPETSADASTPLRKVHGAWAHPSLTRISYMPMHHLLHRLPVSSLPHRRLPQRPKRLSKLPPTAAGGHQGAGPSTCQAATGGDVGLARAQGLLSPPGSVPRLGCISSNATAARRSGSRRPAGHAEALSLDGRTAWQWHAWPRHSRAPCLLGTWLAGPALTLARASLVRWIRRAWRPVADAQWPQRVGLGVFPFPVIPPRKQLPWGRQPSPRSEPARPGLFGVPRGLHGPPPGAVGVPERGGEGETVRAGAGGQTGPSGCVRQ